MNRLFSVKPHEVSIVDRAANRRKFLLLKEDKMDPFKIEEILKGATIENEEGLVKTLTEKGLGEDAVEAAKVILKVQGHFKEGLTPALMAELFGIKTDDGDDGAKEAQIKKLEDEKRALEQSNSSTTDRLDKAEAFIKKAEGSERDRQVSDAMKNVYLPGVDKPKMDETIKKLAAFDTDLAIGMANILDGATKAFQDTDLFKELGSGSGTDTDADEQLKALVKSAMEKDSKLTIGSATEQVCRDNPELYKEQRRDSREKGVKATN